jgi:hypothetical protein
MENARDHESPAEEQIKYRRHDTIAAHASYDKLIRWFTANRCIRQADKLTRILLTASFACDAFSNIGGAFLANPSLA